MHLFAFCGLFLYVRAKASPVFYFWEGILRKADSFTRGQGIALPPGVNFSAANLNKDYFLNTVFLNKPVAALTEIKTRILPEINNTLPPKTTFANEESDYLYLWQKSGGLPYQEEERNAYRVLVSPHGKVILTIPEKLPLNSYGNIALQEYIREATVFLKDKFYWTKLEGIVK